jgi:16S rRNA (uracil1498-N3)-methyltransferase
MATVAAAGRAGVDVRLDAPVTPRPEPAVAITLGVGLAKGDAMDAIVRDGTALGVREVVPLSTAHVALPSKARTSRAATPRWSRVAVAAAKQCGRAVVPVIHPIETLAALLERRASDPILICVEPRRGGIDVASDPGPRPSRALVLVGPEGGWSDEDVRQAVAAGARALDLGPRTLRADLAPAVALSVLGARWGW